MPSKHTGQLSGAADFLKSQYINRWGIVCTAKEQSIGQHMYNVWLLVRAWGADAGLFPDERAMAEELALTHDLAEIRTGDCPTPFKTPDVKAALTELEQSIYPVKDVPQNVKQFVKFCDTAESILFLKLYGLGEHAADVRQLLTEQMQSRLSNSDLPVDSLMSLFTSAYHDT